MLFLGGSLGTLPTSPRATARPLLLPWSSYHGAVCLLRWCAASECEANLLTEYKAVAVAAEVGSSRPAPRGYPLRQRVTAQPKGGMMQLRRWIALAEVAGAAECSLRLLACRSQVLVQAAALESLNSRVSSVLAGGVGLSGGGDRNHNGCSSSELFSEESVSRGMEMEELASLQRIRVAARAVQDALACSQSSWQVGLAEFAATASAAGSGLAMSQCDPGDAAIEVVTSAGSEGSCSSRSSSGSSSRRRNHSADFSIKHPLGGPPPRGLGLLDPIAGWLKAGDEPAFVAHARQALPSDWLQRTFRQQKRFLGRLRRSHFGGKVSVAGSPLLQAGWALG